MNEYSTEAIVLKQENSGEFDKIIFLYTKELGKAAAKAISARKITSKLSGHLEPLNIVKVRLVHKEGFKIADAIALKKIKRSFSAAMFAEFINDMTLEMQADKKLWLTIKKTLKESEKNQKISYAPALEALGFNPKFSLCAACQNAKTIYFCKNDYDFLCGRCALKKPKNELILF